MYVAYRFPHSSDSERENDANQQCPECHAELQDHPLQKTMEMAFLCKKVSIELHS